MEITLARALKYKNRLVGKISTITTTVTSKNSVMKGTEKEVDVKELLELQATLVSNLITLKTEINKANGPIIFNIFQLSELKSYISCLNGIDTTHGKAIKDSNRFYTAASDPMEFESQIRFNDVERWVSETSKEIDNIQEKIDKHNHSTTIDVDVLDEIY